MQYMETVAAVSARTTQSPDHKTTDHIPALLSQLRDR